MLGIKGVCVRTIYRRKYTLGQRNHTHSRVGMEGDKEPDSFSSNCLTDFCFLISVLPSDVASAKLGSGEPCSGVLSTRTSPSCLRLLPTSLEPCRIGDPGMLKSASFEKSKPSGIQHIIFQCFSTLFLNIPTQAGKLRFTRIWNIRRIPSALIQAKIWVQVIRKKQACFTVNW